jgi:hypothetical protein
LDGSAALYVGGAFANIGAQPRNAIAAIDISDLIFSDGFE